MSWIESTATVIGYWVMAGLVMAAIWILFVEAVHRFRQRGGTRRVAVKPAATNPPQAVRHPRANRPLRVVEGAVPRSANAAPSGSLYDSHSERTRWDRW